MIFVKPAMKKIVRFCLGLMTAACMLGVAAAANADVIHLTDGTSVEGSVKRNSEDGWDVTQADGKVVHVSSDKVQQIEATPKIAQPDAADTKLASLRRSVEYLGDLKQIRERYEKFIEQNKGTPAAAEAAKDLVLWQDRMDRQTIKVGGKWITAAEKTELDQKNYLLLDNVRGLVDASRFNEADMVLQQLLADDPANVGALYLRAIIQAKAEQWPLARKTLEAARDALPGHGPTLNNLAVVLWRQNQTSASLSLYEAAMSSPGQFVAPILDNVAEVLNALTPEQLKSPIAQKVARHFADLDAVMQQTMMRSGYYRWGSNWVNQADLAALKAADAEIQKKLIDMQAEYDADAARIGRIDDQVADIVKSMKRIENTSWATDRNGNLFHLPLPSAYYDYDHDRTTLLAQRAELMAKLDSLRAAAKALQQSLPVPKYTGLQKLIGAEGTPMPAVAKTPATTQAGG
jgi:tetratricopeptide (TPR) repeat protein